MMYPGDREALWVDGVNGDSICDQIPLPHGHGSVNFRFSMIPSSLKFQVSWGPQERWPHSRKKLLVKASETPCSCWIIRAGHFRGDMPYTYKVLLRVAQGWRCEASYPGLKSPCLLTLQALSPKRSRSAITPCGVPDGWNDLDPG